MTSAWLPPDLLARRRLAASGPLRPLAASLAADLEPLAGREILLPPEKARLSRRGGRCPVDGAYLRFDPWSPRLHQCPACGASYDDEAHYRWWIMGYHLWLSERAVHAALLHALAGDGRHRALAESVLLAYAEAYGRYPDEDSVLGPSRPFFSTYLESIWLLQLCTAADMLEAAGQGGAATARLREHVVEPSARLIASFPEGDSNRQMWNGAALLAAAHLLGRPEQARALVWGRHGLAGHLSHALLADGSWYEGENYHLFAHRGLWYGVALAGALGEGPLPAELVARFDEGFATPFLTALPDLTFPARRDSQYAVSLRQWRFAELAELGLARRPGDRRLHHALARLYDEDAPEGDTGRWRSTGEAERNEPARRLGRADLGWRSLLAALPELPDLRPRAPGSVLLPAQGLAVFRRSAGRVYAALDYGRSGGGHGHPDRLGLHLQVGDDRIIDDPGTGSYVDPSLHWYRSTLAHHAPMVDGRDQRPADGALLSHEERGAAGWADAVVEDAAPGVTLRRALVVMPGYVVDELSWTADREVEVALPVHLPAELRGGAGAAPSRWESAELGVDGASYLSEVHRLAGPLPGVATLVRPGGAAAAWYAADGPALWWRAVAPGAPGRPAATMHLVTVRGRSGRLRAVWAWDDAVRGVEADGDVLRVATGDGGVHAHRRSGDDWQVDFRLGSASSGLVLSGRRPAMPAWPPRRADSPSPADPPGAPVPLPAAFALGEADYRRSERTWDEAGRPTARVEVDADGGRLVVRVAVAKPELALATGDLENDMDNERPWINRDSVQLHVGLEPDTAVPADAQRPALLAGWLVAPLADAAARVVPLDDPSARVALEATGRILDGGYELVLRLSLDDLEATAGAGAGGRVLRLGVIVNETGPGRERRRGQLVLGGASGEFVYLRGDRHDAGRCTRILIPS